MATDLVREEITTDEQASQALREFDPYTESMLEAFTCSRNAGRSLTCLAFSMGESCLDLSAYSVFLTHIYSGQLTLERHLAFSILEEAQGQP